MAAQDDLFQLIQSLTPSEKRYFKVNANKGGDSKSNYVQLFEAMDGLTEYDEGAFKQKHAKKPFVKYLSAEKKQLREQIMKQMRLFHASRTIDTAINELMQDELFYLDKGLFDHREKALLKAKELAYKYERFHLLKNIIHREIGHFIEFEQKELVNPVMELINEMNAVSILEETLTDLTAKNRELFSLLRSGADVQQPAVRNRAVSLLNEVERYRSRIGGQFRLGVMFYRAIANYHALFRERNEALEAAKHEYHLYQQHPHMMEQDARNYKIMLANLISRAQTAKNNEWYLRALTELKSVPVNSFDEEGEVFQNVHFQEHLYYMNAGDFEKAEALVPIIEKGLETYAGKINKARVLAFQFNIMVMYFIMHRFKECLQWMELLLSDNSEIKQEQKFVSSLLQPIVHFELGHEELVENYTRSAYRLFSKKERLHHFERLVIKYLKGMPLTADQKEFHQKLSEFRDGMKELMDSPGFKTPFGMEEIWLWL
ncbi:MAG: hypothetical protein EP314_00830, partial [Bacteroidetes bacterium]